MFDAFGKLAAEYDSTQPAVALCGTCYLSYDHLGSVRMVTDENGNVVGRHDYAPFGVKIAAGTDGRTGSVWGATTDVTPRFTGQLRDTETGEDYFNARYLYGGLGRFLSADPGNAGADITNPQSWNGYVYVLGNPLGLVDPSGTVDKDPTSGIDGYDCYSAEYASPCGGVPGDGGGYGGISVPIYVGGGGSGSKGGSGSSESLPPGSFPGGENLGLPPGLRVPNPLSPQALMGLWSWDCSLGVCVPGAGPMDAVDPNQIELHHVYVQQLWDWFLGQRMELASLKWTIPMTAAAHRLRVGNGLHTNKIPGGVNWNRLWQNFRKDFPDASPQEIEAFANNLVSRFITGGQELAFPIFVVNPCETAYRSQYPFCAGQIY